MWLLKANSDFVREITGCVESLYHAHVALTSLKFSSIGVAKSSQVFFSHRTKCILAKVQNGGGLWSKSNANFSNSLIIHQIETGNHHREGGLDTWS